MNREQVLRKVQACLRLAKSVNAHEAATALRQARKLMDEYGLTEADALAADIKCYEAPTRGQGGMLPRSMVMLANVIAAGYRCEPLIEIRDRRTTVAFYGTDTDAYIATYAFTVLRRQLDAAKAKHTKRVRKRANKTARGEEFAFGFVYALRELFPVADLPVGRKEAIDLRLRADAPDAETTNGRAITGGKTKETDRLLGFLNGNRAQLNAGLQGGQPAALEHLS